MTDAKLQMLQIRLYDTKISAKLEELQKLKDMITKITPAYSEGSGGSGYDSDKLGSAIAKIIDLEEEINQSVDIFVDEKRHVTEILDQITDPDQFNVLHKRYVEFKTWEKIACEMNMTYRNVCYIHGKALLTVQTIMETKKGGESDETEAVDN